MERDQAPLSPHAGTRGWFRLLAASHRLPKIPIPCGVSMANIPGAIADVSGALALGLPRRLFVPLERCSYFSRDAGALLAPTFVYSKDSMQIVLN